MTPFPEPRSVRPSRLISPPRFPRDGRSTAPPLGTPGTVACQHRCHVLLSSIVKASRSDFGPVPRPTSGHRPGAGLPPLASRCDSPRLVNRTSERESTPHTDLVRTRFIRFPASPCGAHDPRPRRSAPPAGRPPRPPGSPRPPSPSPRCAALPSGRNPSGSTAPPTRSRSGERFTRDGSRGAPSLKQSSADLS